MLTVFDSSGEQTSTSTVITSGNTAPTVVVEAPLDGGLFSFGDDIAFKVTVTDPEDPSVSCSDVQVTFVLGHDEHGHAEQSTNGCTGILSTDPEDVAHGGNVFGVISASYTDKGSTGGVPSLSTTSQVQIRQKHQEVENVVTQSGTNAATTTDVGGGLHRASLAAGDWLRLNGPFNLHQIDTIAFRVADNSAGRTAGSPLGAIELRTGSATTGPIVATYNLVSTGGTAVWTTQSFPISLAGKNELFLVFRNVTGGATGSMFTMNWMEFGGNGVTLNRTDVEAPVGGTVPATLSLSLGAPASFGPFTAGVARTYTAGTTANVISSAGDATLSVADPSSNATGHLVNGDVLAARRPSRPGRRARWAPAARSRPSAARPARPRCSPTAARCPTTPWPSRSSRASAPTMPCARARTARR